MVTVQTTASLRTAAGGEAIQTQASNQCSGLDKSLKGVITPMKPKIAAAILVVAAIALVSGANLLAFASPGTQADPFVTLSYLTDIFRPQVMSDVNKAGQELTQEFDERIAELEAQLEANRAGTAPAATAADKFSVITLSRGQQMTCSVGTEIMLRIGTATGSGSAPALVDYTDGDTLTTGDPLITNHMYLVTIEGNGIRATADTVRVLVRGTYKVG